MNFPKGCGGKRNPPIKGSRAHQMQLSSCCAQFAALVSVMRGSSVSFPLIFSGHASQPRVLLYFVHTEFSSRYFSGKWQEENVVFVFFVFFYERGAGIHAQDGPAHFAAARRPSKINKGEARQPLPWQDRASKRSLCAQTDNKVVLKPEQGDCF